MKCKCQCSTWCQGQSGFPSKVSPSANSSIQTLMTPQEKVRYKLRFARSIWKTEKKTSSDDFSISMGKGHFMSLCCLDLPFSWWRNHAESQHRNHDLHYPWAPPAMHFKCSGLQDAWTSQGRFRALKTSGGSHDIWSFDQFCWSWNISFGSLCWSLSQGWTLKSGPTRHGCYPHQRLPTRPESPACLKLWFVIVNQSVQKKNTRVATKNSRLMSFSHRTWQILVTLETLDAFTVELSWKGVKKMPFLDGWLPCLCIPGTMESMTWAQGWWSPVVGGSFFWARILGSPTPSSYPILTLPPHHELWNKYENRKPASQCFPINRRPLHFASNNGPNAHPDPFRSGIDFLRRSA